MIARLDVLGWACYAPDMPGFGGSFDPEADPPSIRWYADLYHETFCAMESFRGGCHVLGHHSGGVIGTELAARFSGFVRTLTCVGPTIMASEERAHMSKTFLVPFNKPVSSGEHLKKTWDYLIWEGISPAQELDLLQREVIDHIRAWKGRSQIYKCVWAYDCEESTRNIDEECKILGLCARNDVLWPYFDKFKMVGRQVDSCEISGGNFGPDLDCQGILNTFLSLVES